MHSRFRSRGNEAVIIDQYIPQDEYKTTKYKWQEQIYMESNAML